MLMYRPLVAMVTPIVLDFDTYKSTLNKLPICYGHSFFTQLYCVRLYFAEPQYLPLFVPILINLRWSFVFSLNLIVLDNISPAITILIIFHLA